MEEKSSCCSWSVDFSKKKSVDALIEGFEGFALVWFHVSGSVDFMVLLLTMSGAH